MPVDQMIYAVVVPAAMAAGVLLLAWAAAIAWRRMGMDGTAWGRTVTRILPGMGRVQVSPGCAIALAYAIGQCRLTGWPAKPVEPQEWLPSAACGAAVLSVIIATGRLPSPISWIVEGLFFIALVNMMLRPAPMNSWSAPHAAAWLAGLWAAVMIIRIAMEQLARQVSSAAMGLLMLIPCAATGVLLLSAGSATLALLAITLSASVGSVVIVAWMRPALSLTGGGVRVLASSFCGLLIVGYFNDYSGLPALSFLLIAAAPLLAWATTCRPVHCLPRWQILIVRLLSVAIPAGIGAVLGWRVYADLGGADF